MQIAAMNPQYICKRTTSQHDELAKMREITIDSALNEPDSLPKPIQKDIFAEALSTERIQVMKTKLSYEEKQNDKYLFNFLSNEAKASLAAQLL